MYVNLFVQNELWKNQRIIGAIDKRLRHDDGDLNIQYFMLVI